MGAVVTVLVIRRTRSHSVFGFLGDLWVITDEDDKDKG
jgi:hypothetical protein